jgi:hypothetical protein
MCTSWSHKKALRTKAALSKAPHKNTPQHTNRLVSRYVTLSSKIASVVPRQLSGRLSLWSLEMRRWEVFFEQSKAGPLSQSDVLLSTRGRQSLCQGSGGHSHPSFELGQLDGDDSPTPEESVEETWMCKWTDGEYLGL